MSVDLEPDPTAAALAVEDWAPDDSPDEPPPLEIDRHGFEEIDGAWMEKPMGNPAASVGGDIFGFLRDHVRPRKLGRLLGSEGAYRMFPDRPGLMRKPDVSFVAAGRLTDEQAAEAEWKIAPDLAVEVISPNEHAQDAEQKLDEYLRAGVKLVWVVYLPTRNVWAYRPDGTAKLYRGDDTLTADGVLPDFAVRVAELFDAV